MQEHEKYDIQCTWSYVDLNDIQWIHDHKYYEAQKKTLPQDTAYR